MGVVGGADAIVTGDDDLRADAAIRDWLADRSIAVLTAAELVQQLD
jgi:predicted nucleic acid-binding protein